MVKPFESPVSLRRPSREDGAAVWNLVREAGSLDVNSAYAYILLCDRFAATCAVAEIEGRIAGFVSAFVQPGSHDTLFIWQIAVSPFARKKGIAMQLLDELLRRKELAQIRFWEATISPANEASQALFRRWAERHETGFEGRAAQGYPASLFPEASTHEDEWLFRIGPLIK